VLLGECKRWQMAEVIPKLATNPMFDFLMKLGIGAAVGWIADKTSPPKPGRSLNVFLGTTGALVGGSGWGNT